jgi:hypothetical protein
MMKIHPREGVERGRCSHAGNRLEAAGPLPRAFQWNLPQIPDRLDRTTAWVSVSDRTSRGVEGLLTVLPIVFLPVVMRFGKAQTWSIW